MGNQRGGAVQHMDNRRYRDGVVHRQIDEANAELKLGEEADGI